MQKRLFGTDGIRGKANTHPITAEMAIKVGSAVAQVLGGGGGGTRVVIGKDTRMSGDMLEHALAAGICSAGANALLAGILSTPGLAYLTREMECDAGVMVSASHNPFYDNGIKVFKADGFKLTDDMESEIESKALEGLAAQRSDDGRAVGRVQRVVDATRRYCTFLHQIFRDARFLKGLTIVLDCANGATFEIAPAVFEAFGARVRTLSCEPDGININDQCGSEHPERLAEAVIQNGAVAGFAFDGDGDRVIAVDERGSRVTGDRMLVLCAKTMKAQGRLKNNLVVTTVMSNIGLHVALKRLGIDHVITRVGDRYVLEAMLKHGASIGGEDSGHLIFLEHHTTGDGIIGALKVLEAVTTAHRPLSELAGVMEVFPQSLINVEVRDKPPLETVPAIAEAVRRAEQGLGDSGRVLVRYSGTQPLCRVMVEGPSREQTRNVCEEIAEVVAATLGAF
ncbi:MAG: phosphoglucosamine mutase [Deltaproteobacteria bacterium]|nr:phosphoglucosamine mutase [Deltaproteobacteria bacterium]